MHMVSVEQMTAEAIEFIRKHEPEEGYFVAFSGGKDSIVTLELMCMAGVKHQAFYSATGIDPPELCKFIKKEYPEVTWLKPKLNFYEGIRTKHPPGKFTRWCCDELKKKSAMQVPLSHHVIGIRAEESYKRGQRPRVEFNTKMKKWDYKPIFYWLEWHIWNFIEVNGLPYPSLYDEGFNRIGCIVCPFICSKNQAKLNQHRERWPKQYAAFERAVHWWWDNKRVAANITDDTLASADEYLAAWYRGFE